MSVIDEYNEFCVDFLDLIILKSLQTLHGENNWKEIMKHFPFHRKNKLVNSVKKCNIFSDKQVGVAKVVFPRLNCENPDSFVQYVESSCMLFF